MSDAYENALAFAAMGHAVLPTFPLVQVTDADGAVRWQCSCAAGAACGGKSGKHPHSGLVAKGKDDATTDPKLIECWNRTVPDLNFGVCTDKFVVLDVDGEEGIVNLNKLVRKHGTLPPTWWVSTGRTCSRHIYFAAPDGIAVSCSVGKLARHLDIRARGGYVIIPGSRHLTGHIYAFWKRYHPSEHDPAPCPAWLLNAIPNGKEPRPVEDWRTVAANGLVDGERDDGLAAMFGLLLGSYGYNDPETIFHLVRGWHLSTGKPPVGDDQIRKVYESICSRELQKRSEADTGNNDAGVQ